METGAIALNKADYRMGAMAGGMVEVCLVSAVQVRNAVPAKMSTKAAQ